MSNQQVNQSVPKHNDGLQADQFDENILVFDNIFSRGYGFSPQVLTRLPQLSIEAKGLYSYFSSFAGQGGIAFPSTQTILKETNISKNRFYKYRDELEAWLAQAEPSEGASESPTRFLRSTRNPGQGTDIGKSDAAVPTSPASP